MGLRTLTALPCIIGVPHDSWSRGSFAVYPIRKSWTATPTTTPLMKACPPGKHLIHLSRNWAEALSSGLFSSSEEIAAACGITSGRVRQIIRLSAIHPRIASYLTDLEGKRSLRGLSEGRIRPILALPAGDQIAAFKRRFGLRI